jgi:hypothetical protein
LALVAFITLATKFAQYMLSRVDKLEEQEKSDEIVPVVEQNNNVIEGGEAVISRPKNDYKEVLKKENCSSSRKPYKDYNDKQNLTKFNHGTYRDKNGRFQSNKKWKKEQETS